jgi:PAS domain S-box-containing protein
MNPQQAGKRQAIPAAGSADLPDVAAGAPPAHVDLHRLLVESVVDYAIFVLDPGGRIVTWNPGAERLKGYTLAEAVGQHFSIFYPPAEVERGHPDYELAVAVADGRYAEEGWRLRKGGAPFWASVTITALRDEAGGLVGFAKVTRDLTERKQAEEALRESEQRFRLLVQNVREYGIFMLDPRGRVASWNEGAQRIAGYTRDEILGRHFSVFYPDDDRAADRPGLELRSAAEAGHFGEEGWRIRKDGSQFWASVMIAALRDPAGELLGFAKVTRDLTDRRAAEEQALDDARRLARAEAANQAKSEFLATLSHELRTPLNAISGYADLLMYGVHGPLSDAQRKALERIQASQRHLLTLINDLLNFSRIEAGHVTFQVEPVPLAEVAAAVATMTEPQATARAITVAWQPRDTAVVALADRARTEQILLNLVTNALKFTPPGGRVEILHLLRDGHAVLEVADTGVGITAENLEAVFEPFTQIGRSLTSSHEGVGLGLAISRDLARAMGGDLVARSTVSNGSTFVLLLPAAAT